MVMEGMIIWREETKIVLQVRRLNCFEFGMYYLNCEIGYDYDCLDLEVGF